jgi:methylated-DNA-protein-cysteine methyltransferase related protein
VTKARRPRPEARSARGKPASSVNPAWAKIFAVVRTIPRGRVATYGEVAGLAGIVNGHRVAARAMRSCPEHLPWQRVIGKKDARRGQINIDEPEHAALQRARLEAEAVEFDDDGFIPLKKAGWLSTSVTVAPRRRPGPLDRGRPARGKNKKKPRVAR